MGSRNKRAVPAFLTIMSAAISWGCTNTATTSTDSAAALQLSGQLNASGLTSRAAGRGLAASSAVRSPALTSVDLTGYDMYCLTVSNPPTAGIGHISSDGTFTIAISGAHGKKLACYVLDESLEVKATLVIRDTSETSMTGGGNKTTDSAAFDTDADLGTISLDLNEGEALVDLSSIHSTTGGSAIAQTTLSASEAFDPTGNWTIGPVDFTLPRGYRGPCTSQGPGQDCEGPPNGMTLYLKRLTGRSTADATVPKYVLMLWQSEDSFTACGSKLGVTAQEAQNYGIDLSDYSAALGPFSFSTSVTLEGQTVTITDNWKLSSAASQWEMRDCGPIEVTLGGTAYKAWKCIESDGDTQIGIGGGCVNSANTPVQVTDWSGITHCDQESLGSGYQRNTCTGTATVNSASVSVTCTHTFGTFDSQGTSIDPQQFNWSNVTLIAAQNAACSSIAETTSAKRLAKLQCYSNAYWQSGLERASGVCLPRIHTDWTTNNPDQFVTVDRNPNSLIFMDKLDYSDANSASLRTEQEDFRGVRVPGSNGDNWVPCRVKEVGSLIVNRITETRLLASYVSTTRTSSTDPACVAEYGAREEKFLFYLDRQ